MRHALPVLTLLALLALLPLLLGASPALGSTFDDHFTGGTLRFDYHHSGIAGEEHISLEKIRREGEWPGSRTQLLDDSNLGKYFFEVIDPTTHRVLYSRGFSSIYGEWETTGEARRGVWNTLHESMRFPETRGKAQLVLKKRADDGTFREIFSTVIDPESRFIDRSPLNAPGAVWTLFENGSPATKVDLLILGDGYTADERQTFHDDVERLMAGLFAAEPFKSRKGDFNVRAIDIAAAESGVTDPRAGVWVASPLGLAYNAFDSERYVLTYENRRLREFAALAPYDALILLSNTEKYGGGGIYNLWTTAAAHNSQQPYLVVHEFGHSFAGLGDEYYSSQVAYEDFTPQGVEPWEPNITALLDAENLKWKDLVAESTPLPTPWDQDAYDAAVLAYQKKRQEMRAAGASEEAMTALFAEVKASTQPMLEGEAHFGQVGAFEGAGYEAKGLYRPAVDCIMFTRNPDDFCPVCARGIERVIELYSR
jgi:hypothetical protein